MYGIYMYMYMYMLSAMNCPVNLLFVMVSCACKHIVMFAPTSLSVPNHVFSGVTSQNVLVCLCWDLLVKGHIALVNTITCVCKWSSLKAKGDVLVETSSAQSLWWIERDQCQVDIRHWRKWHYSQLSVTSVRWSPCDIYLKGLTCIDAYGK